MKQITYPLMSAVFALMVAVSSCSKIDWKSFKDKHGGNFLVVRDCDAQRVYAAAAGGSTDVLMQKTYNTAGRIATIGFYTFSAVSEEIYWHSFLLDYNISDRTVDIIDSASGDAVLKAIFHPSGRLERLQRLQGDTSSFAERTFEYAGGRLASIFSTWKTFDDIESFTYDTRGNIVRSVKNSPGGGSTEEEAVFTYGAAASDKQQFYIPQYNYMIVADPSMALLQYLGWVDDFSPKNILVGIEYLQPLPQAEDFTAHVFDAGGKLISYSNGDFVGGTKHIDWWCSGH